MKSKDIEIGRIYQNKQFPDVKYLGCGYINVYNHPKKFLIIHSKHNKGVIVIPRKNNKIFWDDFYPTKEHY